MRFTTINTDDIAFGDYASRSIKFDSVQFQIPRMYMPFGVSGFAPQYGPVKYNIDFSMRGWNESGNYVNKFYDFLTMIENKVIDHVQTVSEEIFGRDMTREELMPLFNSNVKFSQNHDPKFRVKVSDKTQFFDVGDVEVETELVEGLYKRYSGSALVQPVNVYFFNKMFGITWNVLQVKVYEPQRLHGFNFAEPDDDEEAGIEKLKGCQFNM
jgi:hypothetical protein